MHKKRKMKTKEDSESLFVDNVGFWDTRKLGARAMPYIMTNGCRVKAGYVGRKGEGYRSRKW
jgi:hypothetical protein